MHLTAICQALGHDIVQDGNDVALVVGNCAPQALDLMWKHSAMLRGHIVHAFQQLLAPITCKAQGQLIV